jgi:hypothetical protein
MTHATYAFTQTVYRGRDDDQTLNSATFDHALNSSWEQLVDVNFRIRFEVAETGGAAKSGALFALYVDINGGGYNEISPVEAVNYASSGQYTNGDATTQVIGSGTFVAGDGVEGTATSGSTSFAANEVSESEWTVIIPAAGVNDGDQLSFRVYEDDGTAFGSYTNTAEVTVSKPAGESRRVMTVS